MSRSSARAYLGNSTTLDRRQVLSAARSMHSDAHDPLLIRRQARKPVAVAAAASSVNRKVVPDAAACADGRSGRMTRIARSRRWICISGTHSNGGSDGALIWDSAARTDTIGPE